MINMNLKFLRKSNNYTQENVAEKINVSRQAIAKWESGETVPDINNCIALAKLYNVKLDDLVNYEDEYESTLIPPKDKHIFGMVKVDERGQIVIPKKARDIFKIHAGDNLLVLGDESKGIAIIKSEGLVDFAKSILESIDNKI